ncbi:hypothetical protein OH76DRAFT_1559833 [Lentinus brumalis]|uniref:Uncharacterized protein n=1 Tax=Lentinus brumalis TaxID=2498619 RepID=A0A371CV78_9APHY|nr:hypothetical protein OH76DRAFT_1559833 [Polyporus brumalis]
MPVRCHAPPKCQPQLEHESPSVLSPSSHQLVYEYNATWLVSALLRLSCNNMPLPYAATIAHITMEYCGFPLPDFYSRAPTALALALGVLALGVAATTTRVLFRKKHAANTVGDVQDQSPVAAHSVSSREPWIEKSEFMQYLRAGKGIRKHEDVTRLAEKSRVASDPLRPKRDTTLRRTHGVRSSVASGPTLVSARTSASNPSKQKTATRKQIHGTPKPTRHNDPLDDSPRSKHAYIKQRVVLNGRVRSLSVMSLDRAFYVLCDNANFQHPGGLLNHISSGKHTHFNFPVFRDGRIHTLNMVYLDRAFYVRLDNATLQRQGRPSPGAPWPFILPPSRIHIENPLLPSGRLQRGEHPVRDQSHNPQTRGRMAEYLRWHLMIFARATPTLRATAGSDRKTSAGISTRPLVVKQSARTTEALRVHLQTVADVIATSKSTAGSSRFSVVQPPSPPDPDALLVYLRTLPVMPTSQAAAGGRKTSAMSTRNDPRVVQQPRGRA